jgi:hypothetical protein
MRILEKVQCFFNVLLITKNYNLTDIHKSNFRGTSNIQRSMQL